MLELNFEPFPVLETERLILRMVTMADAQDMFELRADKVAMRYIQKPLVKSIAEVEALITKMTNLSERIQWAITLKDDNKIIGTIGYHYIEKENYRAEIGYMLSPAHWNTGLMSEAIEKVIEYGFNEMKLHSIEAIINPGNDVSRKTLKKFHFVKEGFFKENFYFDGKFYDSEVYSLLKG